MTLRKLKLTTDAAFLVKYVVWDFSGKGIMGKFSTCPPIRYLCEQESYTGPISLASSDYLAVI